MALTLTMLVTGVVMCAVVVAVSLASGRNPSLAPVMIGGLALVLGSVVPFAIGSLPRLTRIHSARDGSGLVVDDPHPQFIADIGTAAAPLPDARQ